MDTTVINLGTRPAVKLCGNRQRQRGPSRADLAQVINSHDHVLFGFDQDDAVFLPDAVLHLTLAAMDVELEKIAGAAEASGDQFSVAPILGAFIFARNRLCNQPSSDLRNLLSRWARRVAG